MTDCERIDRDPHCADYFFSGTGFVWTEDGLEPISSDSHWMIREVAADLSRVAKSSGGISGFQRYRCGDLCEVVCYDNLTRSEKTGLSSEELSKYDFFVLYRISH